MIVVRTLRLAALSVGMAVAVASSALADVYVLSSQLGSLKRGTLLKDADTIDLPAGSSVTLALPSGATRTLKGPAKVAVKTLTAGQPVNQSVWAMVANLVGNMVSSSDSDVGAVRAMGQVVTASLTEIPITYEGDLCIDRSATVRLVRPPGGAKLQMTLLHVATGRQGRTEFAANDTKALWPEDLAKSGGPYAILAPGMQARKFNIRPVKAPSDPNRMLRILLEKRCERQAQAWIAALEN